MIPGNIDLTENLDFRKVVRKEIPKYPATWKNPKSTFSSSSNITVTNYNSNYEFYIQWVDDTTYYTTVDNVNDYTISEYGTTWHDLGTYTYSTRHNRWFRNNEELYMYYDDDYIMEDSFELDYYDNITDTYTCHRTKIRQRKKEVEYDIFGNKKVDKVVERIPRYPWKYTLFEKERINTYPWNTYYRYKGYKVIEEEIPKYPWEDERYMTVREFTRRGWVERTESRAKKLICYLSNKSESFIKNYLNRHEEDGDENLSYLTNMSWIGVHDAVID